MNRTTLTFALVTALCAGTVRAQTPATATVAQTASPAPSVSAAPASTQAPVVVQAQAAASAPESMPTRVTQIVYTPQLPSAADLTNAAAAQGFTVDRIVQTGSQVIAFYRNASGQPTTVAYQSLPPTGVAPAAAPAPAQVVVTSPPATVVYERAPRVVYYDTYPDSYYYPRMWYPPVSLHLGFGFRSFHGGHYHGGYRHHR
ncbi:MAG: hypothetical protein Q7S40_31665 [Opitutaceae bacterium]|nr:hypothetical protein [Opitutaceae bacterium]